MRTARRWNLERGLPVHRVPGGKGASVFAYSDELDDWLHKSSAEEQHAGEGQPGPDSKPRSLLAGTDGDGVGTHTILSANPGFAVENSSSTSGLAPVQRHVPWGVAIGLAVVLAVVSYVAGTRIPNGKSSDPPPVQAVQRRMLAVLPFANLSGDSAEQYFSDGLTDELTTQLSRLSPRGLGVIARTSVIKYQPGNEDVRQAGHELGVDYLLEGSVLRSGKRARITARLIRVSDQTHVWAESYEADLGDVLEVEAEVSRAIASEIQVLVAPGAQKMLSRARPISPEAHDAYLRGLFFWNRRGDKDVEKSVQYFQEAIQQDPEYAEAYAGLASSYALLGEPRFSQIRVAAAKALSLDPSLAQPHAALGIYFYVYWDIREAEREFQLALELEPGSATAHHWHAYNLTVAGRHREAVEEMRRAIQLDPLSLPVNRDLGLMYYWARDYNSAITQFKRTLEMDPAFHHTHCYLGRAYEQQGKFDLALAEYEKADSQPGSISDKQAALGRIYSRLGRRKDALGVLEELRRTGLKRPVCQYNLASIYAALGDKEEALNLLEKEFQGGHGWTVYLPIDPLFDALRAEPRYQHLAANFISRR